MSKPGEPSSNLQVPPSDVLQEERRFFARYPASVPVDIRPDGSEAAIHTRTHDLSRNGCYVQTESPLSIGVRVHMTLGLNEETVSIKGCVVTRHPKLGNGIMFLTFEEEGQRALRSYLAHLRSDHSE